MLDLTPSDLGALDGCFRRFHWTRILGRTEQGRTAAGPYMKTGTLVHQIMETGITPAGGPDLSDVFKSSEWSELIRAGAERELPFAMHLVVRDRECVIRGRMDAVVIGNVPRVIDYKYATWHEGAADRYEIQMLAYALALMKSLNVDRAVSEVWYLKPPMKIVRNEYGRSDAESRLVTLLENYFVAIAGNQWPAADRSYCDRVECGFRTECWEPT
jgi:hypothetical protein